MAKIDSILKGMKSYGAVGAVVESGVPIMFRFPSGDRFANKKTRHEDIQALLHEIAPPEAGAALALGDRARFTYELEQNQYQLAVEPRPDSWKISITPAEVMLRKPESQSAPAAHSAQNLSGDCAPAPQMPQREPTLEAATDEVAPEADAAPHADLEGNIGRIDYGTPENLVDDLLRLLCERGGSDLHLGTGHAPYLRADGRIAPICDEPLTAETLSTALEAIMPATNKSEFEERNDTDFAHEIEGLSRFRVNVFRDRRGPGSVIRRIPFDILTPDQLGLPKEVLKLCYLTKGLVLVTGPTGSGKSTTLAALIDYINANREDHIITIEDPIEFVHENKKCLVTQREVFTHTSSFKDALRAALREDPDIVLVGEMRDLETIAIAVETAETGHLVFGTLHTTTAPSTIDRIIDQFPADRQEQIRQMVSESLRGVIAQNLCRKIGGGRVAAFEILIGSPAVSNLVRERKTFQLLSVMQTGRAHGMTTLNDSLMMLVKQEKVEPLEAYMKAADKDSFKRQLLAQGHELPSDA